jgi:hypothetical protein
MSGIAALETRAKHPSLTPDHRYNPGFDFRHAARDISAIAVGSQPTGWLSLCLRMRDP